MNRLFVSAVFAVTLLAALFLSGYALAADQKAFDAGAFATLQGADKPILIDVRADWCPTCKRQAPIISSLMAQPEFKNFTVLEVDFDSQPVVLRQFHATQQSTLIVYRGKSELGRSTGDTSKEGIAALLRKANS